MEEQWRDISGYEGLYQVSNLGQVKSLPRMAKSKNDSYRVVKEAILKQYVSNTGYLRVYLYKDGKMKPHSVHRLVAIAFVPNPENLPIVNHKSEVKTENHASNLEWCDLSYNVRYGTGISRTSEKQKLTMTTSKAVNMYSRDNTFIRQFISISEASRETGLSITCISNSCNRKVENPRQDYIFRFAS